MRKFCKKFLRFMHFFCDPERLYLFPVPRFLNRRHSIGICQGVYDGERG